MECNHHRSGTGPPLVLIHGIGSRWQMWEPVLDRLGAEREIVALDLPGFGDSPMPDPSRRAGVQSLTDLVAEFLRELGLERPHLAGNSLGGWISLELAKRGRASSATCLSPAGFHSRGEAAYQRVSLRGARGLARLLCSRADAVLRPAAARRILFGQLAARPERIPAASAAGHMRALAGAGWFEPTLLAITSETFSGGEQLEVPVTIAWGERDRLLLPRQAARAARAIPAARMRTLRGCGHVPTYDDPAQVAGVLIEGSA